VRFLVDNQLPAALARFLSARNVDCRHVLDFGLAQSSDAEICRYAEAGEIVLISKDEDFLHLANRPGAALRLVWIRIGNCRRRALLEAVGRAWPRIVASLEAGER
jgi:predicted nuclease of predicted toxin-antitoxin system